MSESKIWDLWLNCRTYQEIAKIVLGDEKKALSVGNIVNKFKNRHMSENEKNLHNSRRSEPVKSYMRLRGRRLRIGNGRERK